MVGAPAVEEGLAAVEPDIQAAAAALEHTQQAHSQVGSPAALVA